jgi:energy-coupling factor transporter ATP-binding protein EcfA2
MEPDRLASAQKIGIVVQGGQVTIHNVNVELANSALEYSETAPESGTLPDCPYRGLSAFQEADAEFFFGRDRFIQALVKAVKTKPLVAVVGASGSGKSSLVFAGLLPHLLRQGGWCVYKLRPGSPNSRPFHNLAAAILPVSSPFAPDIAPLEEIDKRAEKLQKQEKTLQDVTADILRQNSATERVLLVVDQFEELYTICPEEDRQRFIDVLLAAVKNAPQCKVVLTLRADFCGQAYAYRPLVDVLQNADLKLGSMSREELQTAIEQPAGKFNVKLESGLIGHLLDDIGQEPGHLPLLEFTLTQLWERQHQRKLTHAAYNNIGGIRKAIANHAESFYNNDRLQDEERQQLKRIFLQLIKPGDGTEDTRRLVTQNEVGAENWRLVTKLATERLVVTGLNNATNEETVEVVHEALIREWQRLRDWMEEDRNFRLCQERIRAAKQEWEAAGKDDRDLLRGSLLGNAEEQWKDRPQDFSLVEQEFIKLSLELRDRIEKLELEQERKARKAAQRTVFALLSSFVVIVGAGSYTWWQRQQNLNDIRAVALQEPNRKLLTGLSTFMQEADRLKADRNLQAITYYRSILVNTAKLRQDIEKRPGDFQPGDSKALEQLANAAKKSLVEIIERDRLPELEAKLQQKRFGNFRKNPPPKILDFENQYEPDTALQTTYLILLRDYGIGADMNRNGLIDSPDEAALMPCETLKAIQNLWQKYTNGKCSWVGTENYYEDTDCRKLDGSTISRKIFDSYTIHTTLSKQFQQCSIQPKKNLI